MKWIKCEIDKCVGCRLCQVACAFRETRQFNRGSARIVVKGIPEEGLHIPVYCINCEEAPCISNCPNGAIERQAETGAIVIDLSNCSACGVCISSCPIGAINKNLLGLPQKCDGCHGRPACVEFCPTGALTFTDVSTESTRDYFETVRALNKRLEGDRGRC
jgi:Fe-S-cluster-containing hydrogenase component 2